VTPPHPPVSAIWCMSHRADQAAKRLADRHYNRQKPDSPQFVPPGSCAVFLSVCTKAFWVTSAPMAEYTRHAWAGAWVCSAFRSEGAGKASDLIREAIACTRYQLGEPPPLGMVTFINRKMVRPVMVRGVKTWGRSWKLAGFKEAGETAGGLMALKMEPADMPAPMRPASQPAETLALWGATP
jgi:hypothetical protein